MKLELGLEKSAAHSVCFFKAAGQRESGRVPYEGHASMRERTKNVHYQARERRFLRKTQGGRHFFPAGWEFFPSFLLPLLP